jgi:secreted PhoX family phosphatase
VWTRREVLRAALSGASVFAAAPLLTSCGSDGNGKRRTMTSNIANLGPLGEPDANGVRLPAGFTSRILARTRQEVIPGSGYNWILAPDGGAVFDAGDGGWIYVSNSEVPALGPNSGGAAALRFDRDATLIDAYPILTGTSINCAGGRTPWGTWLSCEEFALGRVWECDPFGEVPGAVRPALGTFQHEAVAVDPVLGHLYLTEDVDDGCFYRFTPDRVTEDGFPDLTSGTLAVAQIVDGNEGPVIWHTLDDPSGASMPTRKQVPASTAFDGGEGIEYFEGLIYFSTKGDHRVWVYDTASETIAIFYDDNDFAEPVLRGVDNIEISAGGDVLVAEDGDDMQIVAITPSGVILPVLQIVGQDESEITGPAFTADGQRLYFSSQRGTLGHPGGGITYEVTGPFFI